MDQIWDFMPEGGGKQNPQIEIPSCFMHFIARLCSCFFGESDIWFTIWEGLKTEFGCTVHHVMSSIVGGHEAKPVRFIFRIQALQTEEKIREYSVLGLHGDGGAEAG